MLPCMHACTASPCRMLAGPAQREDGLTVQGQARALQSSLHGQHVTVMLTPPRVLCTRTRDFMNPQQHAVEGVHMHEERPGKQGVRMAAPIPILQPATHSPAPAAPKCSLQPTSPTVAT